VAEDDTDDSEALALREAYRASSLHEAHFVAGLMRQAEIAVELRNADVFSAAGPLPALAVAPSLWVRGTQAWKRARKVVDSYERRLHEPSTTESADWTCQACGEISPGNFEECWQCRCDRPSA